MQKPLQPVHVIDHIHIKRQNTWSEWTLKQYPAVQLEIFSDGEWQGKLGQACKVVEVRSPHA
jgi:hypothetical protein